MSVFVSHPCLQHSHQLALALFERELLQAFWSGVPVVNDINELPAWFPEGYRQKVKHVPIPMNYRKHPLVFPALIKAGSILPGFINREEMIHKIFHLYDWWVGQHIQYLKPKVVVAYENSSYHTFRSAKAIGARCVLDSASLHHRVGTRFNVDKASSFRTVINRRKDQEICLADMIITCSPFAAESYLEAGVEKEKIKPVLLGAEAPVTQYQWKPDIKRLRFIFAGSLGYRKSIDVILTVFRKIYDERLPAEIAFFGGIEDPKWLQEIQKMPNASYHPGVAQAKLYDRLSESDCLLLPSRFDSFGMVVAEAMACGTPAIVSEMTGAKAMIEQFPGSGWIVEPNAESLYRCIRERLENREELFAARKFALAAARHFTWQAYRQRVGQVVQDFIES